MYRDFEKIDLEKVETIGIFEKLKHRIVDFTFYEYEFLSEKERYLFFWKCFYRLTHLPFLLLHYPYKAYLHVKAFVEHDILKKPVEF